MKKICVYTCLTGDYDNLNEICNLEKNVDYICFTNNKNLKSNTWKIEYIDNENLDNVRLARKIKILGHPIIEKNYDISVWVDASCNIINLNGFLEKECDIDKYLLIGFKHSVRNCIYDEAKECIKIGKDNKDIINAEVDYLKSQNYPKHNGLMETGIIVRKHNNINVKRTMKCWFDMIKKYSKRDQLSFNYSAFITNLNYIMLDLNIYNNNYFSFSKHKQQNYDKLYTVYYDYGNGFSEENREDLLYKQQNDICVIEFKIKKDLEKIRIDYCEQNKIKIEFIDLINVKKSNIQFIDILNYKKIFFSTNDDPQIIINKKYKKGEKIIIKFKLNKMDDIELINIINELLFERKELKHNLLNTINNLKDQVDQYNELKNNYDTIVDSKRWQTINKICDFGKKR